MLTDAFKERLIEVDRVRSLAWDGDFLVDWVIGGRRYGLDGSFEDRSVNYAYPLDAANARFAVADENTIRVVQIDVKAIE